MLARILGTVRRNSAMEGTKSAFKRWETQCRWLLAGSEANASRFTGAALQWLAAFEAKYSRFPPGSLISRINALWRAVARWPSTRKRSGSSPRARNPFLTRESSILPPSRCLCAREANPPVVPDESKIESARALVGWRQVRHS